jgi:hypothetical protein
MYKESCCVHFTKEVPHILQHCFNVEKWCYQHMIRANSPIQLPFHLTHTTLKSIR